jgi:tetratricopeptide (TPR) repeat protein
VALQDIAIWLSDLGRVEEAQPYYDRAARLTAQRYGEESLEYARILSNLSVEARRAGQFEQSLSMLRKSLRLNERALGPDHPEVAADLAGVGRLLHDLGREEEAIAYLDRSIRILEAAHMETHPTALAYAVRALVHELHRELPEAEALCARALSIEERYLPQEWDNVAWISEILARVLRAEGRQAEARQAETRLEGQPGAPVLSCPAGP